MGASPAGQKHIVQGMDLTAQPWEFKGGDKYSGYTYNKRNGPASATAATNPVQQIARLQGMGVNTQEFFKQAKQAGVDPVQGVLGKSGPGLPSKKSKKSDKDKKKKKKKKS